MVPRHLTSLVDWPAEAIEEVLLAAADIKAHPHRWRAALAGRTLAMIFEKPSTRTRVSFEVGMTQLGGTALFLSSRDIQLGRGEPLRDTARVLSRYVDILMARVFAQESIEELAAWASVPVINALSDRFHPCQALADLLTLRETFGDDLAGKRLAYVGDGNNMAHSLLLAGTRIGMEVAVATPPGYEPDETVVQLTRTGEKGRAVLTHDPSEAVDGAIAVYTDVWASMGQEDERDRRLRDFKGWTVDAALMAKAAPDAIFLHCLPAHRGEEVAEDVLEGPQSAVWRQAENRLHVQKALLVLLCERWSAEVA